MRVWVRVWVWARQVGGHTILPPNYYLRRASFVLPTYLLLRASYLLTTCSLLAHYL